VNYRYLVAMIIVMGCDAEDHPWPATTLTIEPQAPVPVTGVGPLDLQVLCTPSKMSSRPPAISNTIYSTLELKF
jgi:hypothetical protein